MTTEERKQLNEQHASNPEPGDYWNEMLNGVCVVLSVTKDSVLICKDKVDVDTGHWTWDLEKTTLMGRDEFKHWLSYKTIPGYWSSVKPKCMMWAVESIRGTTDHAQ